MLTFRVISKLIESDLDDLSQITLIAMITTTSGSIVLRFFEIKNCYGPQLVALGTYESFDMFINQFWSLLAYVILNHR